jgi:hypothetical protein
MMACLRCVWLSWDPPVVGLAPQNGHHRVYSHYHVVEPHSALRVESSHLSLGTQVGGLQTVNSFVLTSLVWRKKGAILMETKLEEECQNLFLDTTTTTTTLILYLSVSLVRRTD